MPANDAPYGLNSPHWQRLMIVPDRHQWLAPSRFSTKGTVMNRLSQKVNFWIG
jgi:hypothetical protein